MAVLKRLRKRVQSVNAPVVSPEKEPRLGRKQRSLLEDDYSVGGVFVSTRTLRREPLAGTETATESVTSTPATSWKSSGSSDHNKNVPLVVSDPESSDTVVVDEAAALGRIMARSRNLPSTWYYSSNHVIVNQERAKRTIAPLIRLRELDEIAREHAEMMASRKSLFHTEPAELQSKFQRVTRRLGENVARGESIRSIHKDMMATRSDKNNILDRRYTHMGMATARGSNGELYLCQVFRG